MSAAAVCHLHNKRRYICLNFLVGKTPYFTSNLAQIRGFFYENALYKFTFDIDTDESGRYLTKENHDVVVKC